MGRRGVDHFLCVRAWRVWVSVGVGDGCGDGCVFGVRVCVAGKWE